MLKPYYQDESVILYCGDNLDVLPQIELGSVDLVVTSPPFNAGFEYEKDMWRHLDHYREWLCLRFTNLFEVCASGAWITCELQDLHVSPEHSHALPKQKEQFNMATAAYLTTAMDRQGFYYKGETIWDRGRWMNNMAGKMACAPGSPALLTQHSRVLFFRKPGGRKGAYQHGEMSNEWKSIWCRSVWSHIHPESDRVHPAVMPYKMAAGLILGWSLPGQTVLDHFAGKGTTLVAAKRNGRKAIGIEARADYCKEAVKALSQNVFTFIERS